MTTEGGGWLRMRLNNSQQVVIAEWDRTNPWYKCADDEAQGYDWITQTQISPDSSPSNEHDYSVALTYLNLATNVAYSASQMTALRNQVTQLANSTRIVATTSDDDGGNRQVNGGGGHEGYIRTAQGSWFLLTPGTNQECGGGQGTWPAGGSRHADYRWHTTAELSVPSGITGINANQMGALPTGAILPTDARLEIHTGGGVSFGYEKQTFLVK